MSLVTRCPACGTAFRAQRAQLSARGGSVRCGKCGTVFDGIAALVEEGADQLALEPSPQLGLFDPSRRAPAAALPDDGSPLPPFMDDRPDARRRWIWVAFSVLALAALGWQGLQRFHAEIGATVPETRPLLRAACDVAGCEATLPRRPDLMSIDSSDLQADPRREGLIVLNAVIRNRARFAQDYPALELTLTDEGDRPVLRRVLAPRDYLETARASAQIAEGVAPGSETALRVFLDAGRTRATGYRLYLFYPS